MISNMINADVVVENKLWNKKIKNPSNYIQKKIKKIFQFNPLKKKRLSFTILLTGNSKMKYLNKKFRNKYKLMYYLIMWKNNLTGITSAVIRLSPK